MEKKIPNKIISVPLVEIESDQHVIVIITDKKQEILACPAHFNDLELVQAQVQKEKKHILFIVYPKPLLPKLKNQYPLPKNTLDINLN